MNFLQRILGMLPVQNTQIPATPVYSPELEHTARQRGFRNADEMVLWHRQQAQPSQGGIGLPAGANVDTAMSWHPANILSKVMAALNGATGN